MSKTYYKKGDWNVIEDIGGRKVKASKTRKRWDGFRVLDQDYEERHPQDFVRAVPDDQSVPWTRSEGEDKSINPCVYWDSGIADPLYVIMTKSECEAL